MMRAGQMDRIIELQTFGVTSISDAGAPTEGWTVFKRAQAQLLQSSTEEFQRAYGEGATTAVVFRIYWIDGVTTDHRVLYGGRYFNVREIREIGFRVGLELRCEEVRDAGA